MSTLETEVAKMVVNDHNLGNMLNELNCWCMNWEGNINAVYGNEDTVLMKLQKLFYVVKTTVESQVEITDKFKELYDFAHSLDVEYLKKEIEKVKNGDYVSLYLDSIINWIDKNLQAIVARIVKQVFFQITPDGYFTAYIPESWSDITFDTIMNCDDANWGRLVLKY